jgi:hypothetical protein
MAGEDLYATTQDFFATIFIGGIVCGSCRGERAGAGWADDADASAVCTGEYAYADDCGTAKAGSASDEDADGIVEI